MMRVQLPWDADKKEKVYNKIESGEYGTKETTEPNCRKIIDNSTRKLVGYICVKCGRIFSENSGGYRYQHIRNCQGSQTTVTNKYSKKGSKIKTVNKPVPIPPTRLTNGIQSVPQIAHGFDNSNLKISNWLSGIPTNSSKEKFLADISKVILTHLPFSSASRIINSFGNLLGDSRSNDGSFNINDPPSYSVNDVSNYEQNEVPVINLRDSNSNTPISQIKSELQENDNIPDINALQVLQNIITS